MKRPFLLLVSLAVLSLSVPILAGGTLDEETASSSSATPAAGVPASAAGRVVVLGFDGADARTIRELMAASPGRFPTFEKLSGEGTFAPLEVVAPPESPVSWAALNTGQNPAKTGVPGFIRRYNEFRGNRVPPMPFFGHIDVDQKVPIEEFENLPIPAWSAMTLGTAAGATGFVVVFLLALLLFRRLALALVLGVLVGGLTGFGGWKVRSYLPSEIEITTNPNKARNFWDFAAEAGVETVVIDAAQAFDMPAPAGARVLAGLGVPDARGGLGDWFVFTTDPEETDRDGRRTTTAGTVYRVDARGDEIHTQIEGPTNFWKAEQLKKERTAIDEEFRSPSLSLERTSTLSARKKEIDGELAKDVRTSVPLDIRIQGDSAAISLGGQEQTISVGEWSDFYEITFEMNPILSAKALTRIRLVQLEPYFEIFVNVLDIDPREPPFWQPISSPHGFAGELAADCGLYETYGWPTTTMPVKDKEVDPELLMEDVEFNIKWREKLTHSMLEKDDWRVLMSVFSTPDRVQHMMYQFYDTGHPLYDEEKANRTMTFFGETIRLGGAVPAIYEQMDRIIGDVMEKLEPEDTLLVCSDHGFQSFRRQFNVNNWLAENGFLTVKDGLTKRDAGSLGFVDWDETRVYSLGMGFLYLNLEGREMFGIVKPSEKAAVLAELKEKLLTATDPDTGVPVVKSVYVTEEVHEGPYLHLESDMMIGFAPTYRVSWSSTGGGLHVEKNSLGEYVPGPVVTDNTSPWSGGHISVNLPDVAGVFFSNRKVDIPDEGVRALQIAPTVLDLVGVAKPAEMDLEPLRVN